MDSLLGYESSELSYECDKIETLISDTENKKKMTKESREHKVQSSN